MKVGDTVYVFDENNREYRRDASGKSQILLGTLMSKPDYWLAFKVWLVLVGLGIAWR